MLGLRAAGRRRTLPVMRNTNSLRTDRRFRTFRRGRVADDLRQAFTVAQVDKNYPAVIAAAMRPAAQADSLVELIGVE